jgi:hypothetical protein
MPLAHAISRYRLDGKSTSCIALADLLAVFRFTARADGTQADFATALCAESATGSEVAGYRDLSGICGNEARSSRVPKQAF